MQSESSAPLEKQIDFMRRALVGPWGAPRFPIPPDRLSVELVYRHHREAGVRSLVGPADSHAIAALERVEDFKLAVMGKRSDSLHHALGSVEAGPYHSGTRILQSEVFGKEARHIDRLARVEQLYELAKCNRLNRHSIAAFLHRFSKPADQPGLVRVQCSGWLSGLAPVLRFDLFESGTRTFEFVVE
jgi:hypothetical protein